MRLRTFAMLALSTTMVGIGTITPSPAMAEGPRPNFQLPFSCGQQWRLESWGSAHSPALDMFRSPNTSQTEGSPLLASAAGVVNQSYSNPSGAGHIIQINHGGSWFTTYIHLQSRTVGVGQSVQQGQLIGYVGHSGETSNGVPHLHYEQGVDWNGDGRADWGTVTPERVAPAFAGYVYGPSNGRVLGSQNCGSGGVAMATSLGSNASTSGRMEAFRVSGGRLQSKWQNNPNGSWSTGWVDMGASALPGGVAAINNADGRLEVFALGGDGMLYSRWQQAAGTNWSSGWTSMGGIDLRGVAAGRAADGRLQVFVVGGDGRLYSKKQAIAGGTWTPDWQDMGLSDLSGSVAVGRQNDGRLEVFAVRNNGRLANKWQSLPDPDGQWDAGWADFGIQEAIGVAVGSNGDGRLEVFAVGSDGHLYQRWDTLSSDETAWSSWANVGGNGLTRAVGASSHLDGRLDVAVVGGDGVTYHRTQIQANGSWFDWQPL